MLKVPNQQYTPEFRAALSRGVLVVRREVRTKKARGYPPGLFHLVGETSFLKG